MAVRAHALLDRVPLDRVAASARTIDPGRALLTAVTAMLYALGYLAACVVGLVGVVVAWTVAAIQVGWQDGRAHGRAAHANAQVVRRSRGPA